MALTHTVGGLEFRWRSDTKWTVTDFNFGVKVGDLVLEEGPGWILTSLGTTFLDWGQMYEISKFIGKLVDAGVGVMEKPWPADSNIELGEN